MSKPAMAASRVLMALRQCPTTGIPNWCAVSQTSFSSSSVQVEISPPSLLGRIGSPLTWTLIQSTPILICLWISLTISSGVCTIRAYPRVPSSGSSRAAVPPMQLIRTLPPVVILGPSMTPPSIASRRSTPTSNTQSASKKLVKPARSTFCAFTPATSAARP